VKEAALKWYRQAKHDLKMAEGNIDIGGFDIAAFLSHQAEQLKDKYKSLEELA
jgi:HEPN domain-containing protein